MQGLFGFEDVLPNPVYTKITAQDIPDHGYVKEDGKHDHEIQVISEPRQPRIRLEYKQGPDRIGRVEIQKRDNRQCK